MKNAPWRLIPKSTIIMKHLFWLVAGSTIILPAIILLASGDCFAALCGLWYCVAASMLPTSFGRKVRKSSEHYSKILLGC